MDILSLLKKSNNENLEYTTDYQLLQQSVIEKPEQQFGSTIINAEPPDWSKVEKMSLALCERTIDLRVLSYLTCAWSGLKGLSGYANGLNTVIAVLDDYWDDVYPKLVDEDDDDPMPRINAILSLSNTEEIIKNFRNSFVFDFMSTRYTIKDIEAVLEESQNIDSTKIDKVKFINILQEEQVKNNTNIKYLLDIENSLNKIKDIIITKLGIEWRPNFGYIFKIVTLITNYVKDNSVDNESVENVNEPANNIANDISINPTIDNGYKAINANVQLNNQQNNQQHINHVDWRKVQITNRNDTVILLERIKNYFELYEPSHPAPFMITTLQKTIELNFYDMLKLLSPDALPQFEKWLTKTEKSED